MAGDTEPDILDRILLWGRETRDIEAIILEGSRVIQESPDPYSDFDIGIFAANPDSLLAGNLWYENIRKVWVAVHESFIFEHEVIHTRLVIYAGGFKVDFAIYPAHLFEPFMLKKPWANVPLDKQDRRHSESAGRFGGIQPEKPARADFDHLVQEFWFEAYHVAKYLSRNELWQVKFRDWSTKESLLTMLEWYTQSLNNWESNTWFRGKNIHQWAPDWVNEKLPDCFGHYEATDGWRALSSTVTLFQMLSDRTGELLGFSPEEAVPSELKRYIIDQIPYQ
jgi:aminoglycoside 6-adenylyltransferase